MMRAEDGCNPNRQNADLSGANLSFADLTGAVFCNTTMPDGSTNNSGC
ncbi:MAG: pentapeptide repeat-containing protein [Candidatus Nanopelagicales bacterium]